MKWLHPVRNFTPHLNESFFAALRNHSAYEDNKTTFCVWATIRDKKWDWFEVVDYMLTGPLLAFFILVGVVSGIGCIVTFWRGYRKMRLYAYLCALAVWDVMYLLLVFYLYPLPTIIYNEIISFGPLIVFAPFFYYLGTVARVGCVWTVWIVAVERYIALCHPFKFNTRSTSVFDGWIIFAVVAGCSLLFCLPRYLEIYVDYCLEISELTYVPRMVLTRMRNSTLYWLFYRVFGGLLLYSVGPFLTLVVLTVKIGVEISKMSQRFGVDSEYRNTKSHQPETSIEYERSKEIHQKTPSRRLKWPLVVDDVCIENLNRFDERSGHAKTHLLHGVALLESSPRFSHSGNVKKKRSTSVNDSNVNRRLCDLLRTDQNRPQSNSGVLLALSSIKSRPEPSKQRGAVSFQKRNSKQATQQPNGSNSSKRRGSDHTGTRLNHWMHVAMIGKFLLCHTFPVLLDIWELFHPSVSRDRRWIKAWHMMSHVSAFLVALNSSCNFFIYFATSKRFRADFWYWVLGAKKCNAARKKATATDSARTNLFTKLTARSSFDHTSPL